MEVYEDIERYVRVYLNPLRYMKVYEGIGEKAGNGAVAGNGAAAGGDLIPSELFPPGRYENKTICRRKRV